MTEMDRALESRRKFLITKTVQGAALISTVGYAFLTLDSWLRRNSNLDTIDKKLHDSLASSAEYNLSSQDRCGNPKAICIYDPGFDRLTKENSSAILKDHNLKMDNLYKKDVRLNEKVLQRSRRGTLSALLLYLSSDHKQEE